MPEHKPKFLSELISRINSVDNAVGFSNDGDADRYGVINENGDYVTPNEVMCMLLLHLVKNKKMKGKYVKTVGASLMHDILAQKLGLEIIETPVGFKHVGQAMRENHVILAGEESGGLSIKGHIPEKDGLLANLLVLEMMAYENKKLSVLQQEMHAFIGLSFINDRIDVRLDNAEKIKNILSSFENNQNLHKKILSVVRFCSCD